MKRSAICLLALTAVAGKCGGDDTADSGTPCENSVVETFPADGAPNAYYRTTVEVKFDDAEDDATFTVSDSSGPVAGALEWADDRLIFTPTAPFAPSTAYTVDITFSCGEPSVGFTTSEVGSAIGDITTLEGSAYALDLASGRFVHPEGVGALLQDYLTQSVLIGVETVDSGTSEIWMLGAIANPDDTTGDIVQEPCDPSIPFPDPTGDGADFSGNPFFQVGPETTTINVAGFSITIEDLLISGAFAPDASYIAGAVLAGAIDTRPLVPLLDPGCDDPTADNYPCDENAICALAASISVSCEDCGGSELFCLSLYVDSIAAEEWEGTVQLLSELGSGDANDPCTVNATECGGEAECAP